MSNLPRGVRRVGYVVLWLATAVLASATRSAIPAGYQELAPLVAGLIFAGFTVAILVKQAKPMARTLRSWRDQL
jgi:hypothetical protein